MQISVVIPTFNEQENIGALIGLLQKNGGDTMKEIIVVDGESTDKTIEITQQKGVIALKSPQKGRAAQMNYGAKLATGDVLYFVHADTRVLPSFVEDIQQAFQEGYLSGCYRFQFDSPKLMLKINSYFTRFNLLTFRGGDQTLFISKVLFDELGGFDEYYVIMEEYDLLRRLWAKNRSLFKLIPKSVLVSARKYDTNSWLRVQLANLVAVILFRFGINPTRIAHLYKQMLNYR
ncbi:MAG: TIGR04283 family arsenosugar biosynthesis glycosyltransferase [Spirosomataceae bacterium]